MSLRGARLRSFGYSADCERRSNLKIFVNNTTQAAVKALGGLLRRSRSVVFLKIDASLLAMTAKDHDL